MVVKQANAAFKHVKDGFNRVRAGFKKLSYAQKSQVITSWMQAIVIVVGVPVALTQLSTSQQSLEDERMREAIKSEKEHDHSQSNNRELLTEFFKDASELNVNKPASEAFETFDEKWDQDQIANAFEEYISSVDKLIYCARARVCDEIHIESSLCWEIIDLLVLANKIESFPESWKLTSATKDRLERRFYITCPFEKTFGYSAAGDL